MAIEDPWDLPAAEALQRLRAHHGATWLIWYVPCWDGRRHWLTWCARRHADRALLHATRPAHLAEYINAVDAEAAASASWCEAVKVAGEERDVTDVV